MNGAITGILLGRKAKLTVVDKDLTFTITGHISEMTLDAYLKECHFCLTGKDPKLIQKKKKKP